MHPDAHAPVLPATAAAGSVRPLGGLAAAASILIGAAAIAWAYTVHVYGWTYYGSLARISGAGFSGVFGVSATGIAPIKGSVMGLGVALLISMAAAAFFLGWLARARANAEVLSAMPHRHGSGWVVGAWFVPFANLVIPARVVGDVWRASAPQDADREAAPVVTWWLAALCTWALFDIALVVRTSSTLSVVHTSAVLSTVQGLLTVLVAGLAIVVVQRITRWQTER